MNICKENQYFLYPPPKIFSLCLKTFFYTHPEKFLVCFGGESKTETGKFHEILTSVCGGVKKLFYTPSKNYLYVCGGVSKN